MPLTSADETDLLLPLFDATVEARPFHTFLTRLQRRTQAHHLNIAVRTGQRIREFHVGPDMRGRAAAIGDVELQMLDKIGYDQLRPGRVYSADEFVQDDPDLKTRRADYMRRLEIADERVVRVLADAEASAWLIMARTNPCTAADSALLSNLAPYLERTLRTLLALDRQRLSSHLSLDHLDRSGAGWIAFDRDARVVAVADATSDTLARVGVTLRPGARATALGPKVEHSLTRAAAHFVDRPEARPQSVRLVEDPRIDALLTPADEWEAAVLAPPAMIAHLRWPKTMSPARAEHLANLFGLARREAELAVGLADGLSLSEAGSELGLTIETTRNYSKRLYAKLGVRGQAEVVRLIAESAAALA